MEPLPSGAVMPSLNAANIVVNDNTVMGAMMGPRFAVEGRRARGLIDPAVVTFPNENSCRRRSDVVKAANVKIPPSAATSQ